MKDISDFESLKNVLGFNILCKRISSYKCKIQKEDLINDFEKEYYKELVEMLKGKAASSERPEFYFQRFKNEIYLNSLQGINSNGVTLRNPGIYHNYLWVKKNLENLERKIAIEGYLRGLEDKSLFDFKPSDSFIDFAKSSYELDKKFYEKLVSEGVKAMDKEEKVTLISGLLADLQLLQDGRWVFRYI